MQELFRWLIDLSVIQLLEEKKLKKSDFIVTENYHIRLREQTARALIERIRFNMNTKAPFNGRNATYQTILYRNVQRLANFTLDKTKILNFEVLTPTLKRNDTLDMRQRILAMTPDERRRLGITKSGLWYLRRNSRKARRPRCMTRFYLD